MHLSIEKGIDAVIFHVLQVIDDVGVVADAVYDMLVAELLEPAAREFSAFMTSDYVMLSGTGTETGYADRTVFGKFVRHAPFTGFGVGRACSAEQAADASDFFGNVFHDSTSGSCIGIYSLSYFEEDVYLQICRKPLKS